MGGVRPLRGVLVSAELTDPELALGGKPVYTGMSVVVAGRGWRLEATGVHGSVPIGGQVDVYLRDGGGVHLATVRRDEQA